MATHSPHTLMIMAIQTGPEVSPALPWDTTSATIDGTHTLTVQWALSPTGRPEPVSTTWECATGTTAKPPVPAGRILAAMRELLAAQLDTTADTLNTLGAAADATRYREMAAKSRKRPGGPGRPPGDPQHPGRLAEVAQTYNDALSRTETRQTPAKAVRQAFPGYAPRTIGDWIRHARDAGLITTP